MFIGLLSICTTWSFGESLVSNLNKPKKSVSLNNQPCQVRPALVAIYYNENIFYSYTVSVNKCGGSCRTIDDSYPRACVLNKVKDVNAKILNLMSDVNDTRCLVQHELCECRCRLKESVCNLKHKRNYDGCRCECKELDDWVSRKNDFMWNLSKCDCECNKAWKIDEYLDIKN